MNFEFEPVRGTLIRRYKRFLSDIELQDGTQVLAHCPNPGAMTGNAEPGSKVFLKDYGASHLKDGRKLRYRWILVDAGRGLTCIDTSMANQIVGDALRSNLISELSPYEEVIPEFTIDDSRLDFLLLGERPTLLEVKSVSLFQDQKSFFPDSVTLRGQKHLRLLMEMQRFGIQCVIFYLICREGVQSFSPADWVDPDYGDLLREARDQGVQILAYDQKIDPQGMQLGNSVEIVLE